MGLAACCELYVRTLDRCRGMWNVPHVTNVYMIQAFRIPAALGSYVDPEVDPDIAFCARLREKVITPGGVIFCLIPEINQLYTPSFGIGLIVLTISVPYPVLLH